MSKELNHFQKLQQAHEMMKMEVPLTVIAKTVGLKISEILEFESETTNREEKPEF